MPLVYNDITGNFEYREVPPRIQFFSAQQSGPFYQGDTVTLIWQVDSANHIYFDEQEQTGNSAIVRLDEAGSQTFKIKATNSDGIDEKDYTLNCLPLPNFNIHTSATILHKGQNEDLVFRWNIENARDIKLVNGNNSMTIASIGEAVFKPIEDTIFVFEAKGTQGDRIFRHYVTILIREPAKITFSINRQFSFPNLPLTLSWNIDNATNVSIDNFGQQPNQGSLEVSPGVDTTYVIRVNDAFGEEHRSITVRMLPLPVIKQILVPTPKIEKRFDISYATPQFNASIPVPTFESVLIKLKIPHVPSFKDSFFVKSTISKQKKSFLSPFKSLFFYFFRNE